MNPKRIFAVLTPLIWYGCVCCVALSAGEIEIRILEAETNKPIGARLEITDQRGRHPHPAEFPFWRKEFTIDGPCRMKLAPGTYRYRVERGPDTMASSVPLSCHETLPIRNTLC